MWWETAREPELEVEPEDGTELQQLFYLMIKLKWIEELLLVE